MTDTIGKAVKDFLAEAEEIVDQLNADLLSLGDCADAGDTSPDLVNAIFRGAHSLKGLAGMFGFTEIAELAHNLENLLDSLRLGKISLEPGTLGVLFDSMELLGSLVRSAGQGGDTADIAAPVQRINACLNAKQGGGKELQLADLGLPEKVLNTLTEYEEHRLLENFRKGRNIYSILVSFNIATFDQDLGELTDLLRQAGELISTLPSASGNLEAAIDFELLFGAQQEIADVITLVNRDTAVVTLLGAGARRGGTTLAVATDTRVMEEEVPSSPALPEDFQTAKSMSRTVRVDIGKLDELMNIVGELVLSHSAISIISDRLRQDGYSALALELGKAAKNLNRRLTDLQKGVMEIRMIPVGQLYEKMSRIVRKISREQGKKVDLRLFGADTELDKLIIEDISDPMMHIIRNAIDHAIEKPEERLLAGKDEKGCIRLSSYHKGNHVVIEVEDDGRGIDREKVRRKAVEKKLISASDHLSDHELLELIFLPGFSTSETVSEISGRGVGMDVVKSNLSAVSGIVDVESVPSKGSKFTITLPITLAIIKALIIESCDRTYALPITSVLESLMIRDDDIKTVEKQEVIQLRETTLPLLRIGSYFGVERTSSAPPEYYVVVVGVAEKRLGIIVDDLLGQQDIVIKAMGETFKGIKGISGAADLGDQRTILVLDVGGIINETMKGAG